MTLKSLALAALTAIATLSLTSCLEENSEAKFSIDIKCYLLQEGEGENTTFTPYFYFNSSNGQSLKDLTVSIKSGENHLVVKQYCDFGYKTIDTVKVSSPDKLNGTYFIEAITKDGKSTVQSFDLKYAATDGLEPISLNSFSYNGTYMRANINEMKNVYAIGFVSTAYNKDSVPYKDFNVYFFTGYTPSFINGKLDITQQFFTSSQLAADYADVRVFVATSNSIFRESKSKTLQRNVNYFLEDKEVEKQ